MADGQAVLDVAALADPARCTHTTVLNSGMRYRVQVIDRDGGMVRCILFQGDRHMANARWLPKVRLTPLGTTTGKGEK